MKIGLLVYDIGLTGGAEKVAEQLCLHLSGYHNSCLISVFDSTNICDSKQYETFVLSQRQRSITKSFRMLTKKLRDYIRNYDIDILVAITAGVVTLANAACRGQNTAVIYAEHSNLENKTYGIKHQLRQRLGAAHSDAVVTLTERDRRNFIKQFDISPNKVRAIPNWHDPSNIDGSYNPDSKRIITVGRLETVKGYNYLLDVAKKIKPSCQGWSWDIYGDGSLKKTLIQEIKTSELDSFIELKGCVDNMPEVYPDYAMFVMTSVYEGFPLVLLEAQAAGLPVVSFDCPTGPAEIIDDGTNGLVIPSYDTSCMASAIVSLVKDREERIRLASNSKANLKRYSMDAIIPMWLDLFNAVHE